jgi:hypothetical protein
MCMQSLSVAMARTVSEGFNVFLERLIPSPAERAVAAKHRNSVESSLQNGLGLYRFKQTGSLAHGTGITIYSDVDHLASLKGVQPVTSSTALRNVKECLQRTFPSTTIRIDRPAVVIEFASGAETFEVVPGWIKRGEDDERVYAIPGRSSGWLESAPDAHINYVNDANQSPAGGAKKLARLLKAWKYYCNVPISSFYLEMQAARHMKGENSIIWSYDVRAVFRKLHSNELAAMNDPSGLVGRIYACGTDAQKRDAKSKLSTALTRANNARDAEDVGNLDSAFSWWDKVFDGRFPSR